MTAGTSGSGHSNRPKTIDVEISPAQLLAADPAPEVDRDHDLPGGNGSDGGDRSVSQHLHLGNRDPGGSAEGSGKLLKATVTGDVRNRLGTLSQQILSASRLQKIIESLNLYQQERKEMVREDVQAKMRRT